MSSLPDKVPATAPEPFIAADRQIAEFTVRAVVLGTLLGMVFGASSLYLVLKVGLTVSASIPVAVIAITLFRLVSKAGGRDSTILENNIVQTAGSAGESIAFGLGVTLPAILILGFDLDILRVLLVGVLGGLLGILMMIPLRRSLIVSQHETLKYPEGTACAEVLKAAELSKGSIDDSSANASRAGIIFAGFGIGLLYKALNVAFKGWKDVPEQVFGAPLKAGSISCEISPELLGVGYIIGPRIAALMCAGGVLAYLLLIPMIAFFGDALTVPLAPGVKLIRDMSPDDIRGAYVLYIGAGAVAAGGIVSLIRALPMIWHSLHDALRSFSGAGVGQNGKRTDQDIPMKWVLIGSLLLVVAIMLATPLQMNLLGALLILVFGFLFSTVSSQLTGEIGSSSNPISGMTVATLLFTCLIFLLVGWTGGPYYVTALSVGAIVCIASSNAGTTSQDLKTGYLVGGTPRLQQYAILFGALASALMLGPILIKLNDAATVYVPIAQVAPGLSTDAAKLTETAILQGPQAAQDDHRYRVWHKTDLAGGPAGKYLVDDDGKVVYLVDPGINGAYKQRPDGSEVRKYDAPKAVLMSYIIKGILNRQLPWALVLFGVMIALVLEMSGVPSLAFAVGVYLPLSSSMPIFVGGLVRWAVDRRRNRQAEHRNATAEEQSAAGDRSPGVLMASGYIAGGALAGIIIAFTAGVLSDFDTFITDWSTAHNPFFEGSHADLLSVLPYALLVAVLYGSGRERARRASIA
ncbi:OPT family oligopeptide transporter [Nevskia sp.]|uniref:OPT family oligopeptide transporter n=1 Tax=Nevskia sp. TaxID=1929292 RepID=UPI0025F74411|nr:oligopeptide transporter, OPT family [Nevskia sp.]